MVVIQLVGAAILVGTEQVLKSRYGALAVVFLVLFGIGVKARNTKCLLAGAAVLFLLMAQA